MSVWEYQRPLFAQCDSLVHHQEGMIYRRLNSNLWEYSRLQTHIYDWLSPFSRKCLVEKKSEKSINAALTIAGNAFIRAQ
jgi:hypothetical protein